ncbi:hypothetical protein GCM10023321_08300 [Pseudonocardia eucalypti]|uniref:CBS domain-containing protein n=1 Tax=Pseudonocardia eucalypti TaxID=648755 RepID=A0ABP9PJ98_9PSEU
MAIGHSPASLRELVDHSAQAGALDPGRHDRLIAALQLHTTTLRGLARPVPTVHGVHSADTVERVREVARDSGHLRLVVWPTTEPAGTPIGMVHVRDTLTADPTTIVSELTRPVLTLAADTPVYPALSAMRAQASQFALVTDGTEFLGLVTMHDLLDRLLPPSDAR